MNKGMLVLLNAGQEIPSEFLEKVLVDYPRPFGCACVQEAGEILWQQTLEGATLSSILSMLENYKGCNRLMSFGGNTEDEDDLQPFILLADENDNPEIVGFLVGDFPAYHSEEGTKSDAHYAIESVVRPKIDQFAELADNDIEKIMAALNKQTTANDFHAMMGAVDGGPINGALAILGKTGNLKLYSDKAIFGASTGWGWTSKVYDTTEKVVEAPITKGKGNMGLPPAPPFAKPTTTQVGATTIIHKQEAPKKEPATDTAAPNTPEALIQVPKNLSNKELRSWFNKKLGFTPEGWHRMKGKMVSMNQKKPEPPKVLKDLRDLNPDADVGKAEPVVSDTTHSAEKPKDVGMHHITPSAAGTSVPVIPAAQLKAFDEIFLKSPQIKEALKGNPSLEAIAAMEKIVPNFTKQTNVALEDTFTWQWAAFLALAKDYPQLLAVYAINCRNELIKFFLAAPKGDKKIEEQEEEAEITDAA